MKRRTSVVWAGLLKNQQREEGRYMKWLVIVLVASLLVLSTGAPTFAQPPEPMIPFDRIIANLLCTAENVFGWPPSIVIGEGLGIEVLQFSDEEAGDFREVVVILSYGNNQISLAILYVDDDDSDSLTCGDPIVAGAIVDD